MKEEPRHRVHGDTIDEWVAMVPKELPRDAVGLWQIVPAGRDGFGLQGADLDSFVRRCILALIGSNAVPVRHKPDSPQEWVWEKQYGTSGEEIATAVIREWRAMPDDPLVLCGVGVWFARPDPTRPNYVKLD